MSAIHTTTAAAAVPLSAVLGGKVGSLLSDAVTGLPDWLAPMLGPAGALLGTLVAIRWLLTRLDRVEAKSDKRDVERDANMQLLATMVAQNQAVISQNSEALSDFKNIIQHSAQLKQP